MFQFLSRKTNNRNSIFRTKWNWWISFFVNRWCVEEKKLDWRFLNDLVTQKVFFSLATMFRNLFSFSHFLDLNKEQEIRKKCHFYLTNFLSISAFDLCLLSEQAFLKNHITSCAYVTWYRRGTQWYKTTSKYPKAEAWDTVRIVPRGELW